MTEQKKTRGSRCLYVARYDYPQSDVKAGQVFDGIAAVPPNIAVEPVPMEP